MPVARVNERSTAYLTVAFRDKTGAAETPSSVTYSVVDVASRQVLRASTPLAASAAIEIELTPDDNAILDASREFEQRCVTVEALFGAGGAARDQFDYLVRNLSQIA